MATQSTLYENFTRVKDWSVEKFVDKQQLAYSLSDVAFSGDYNDLINTPDLSSYITSSELSNMSYATTTYVNDAIAAIPGVDLTGYATEAYVTTAIGNLVNSAPAALDTLEELANALGDDPNFATTITNELSYKANSVDVYSKTDIQGMAYITMDNVSACGYLTAVPSEYITDTELSAMGYISSIPSEYITDSELSTCGYTTPLTQAEMDTLFPISNS